MRLWGLRIVALFQRSRANSGYPNPLQVESPNNAETGNNEELVEVAAKQLATLLLNSRRLSKNPTGKGRNDNGMLPWLGFLQRLCYRGTDDEIQRETS